MTDLPHVCPKCNEEKGSTYKLRKLIGRVKLYFRQKGGMAQTECQMMIDLEEGSSNEYG